MIIPLSQQLLKILFCLFIQLLMICINGLSLYAFPKGGMHTAKMSDSEIITLSICGELIIDSEKAWYSWKRVLVDTFFRICVAARDLTEPEELFLQVTELLRQKLAQSFPIPDSRYFVIDSFPLPVCKFGRARYCRSSARMAQIMEKCPSKRKLISVQSTCPYYHRRLCNCF